MYKYVLASALAFAVAVPAAAAGPRVEVRGGYDSIKLKLDYQDVFDSFNVSDSEGDLSLGGEVGYDFPVAENVDLGVYGGVDFGKAKYCTEVFGLDRGCLKAGRNFTVGVRAIAPVGSAARLYVKGGYSNGQIKVSYEDFENILEDFSDSVNRGGIHVGIGGEISLSRNVYGKAEYVFTNYKGDRYTDEDVSLGLDGSRQQALVGIGVRF